MNADARRMFFGWRTLSETMFMYISFISSKGRNVHSHLKVIKCRQSTYCTHFWTENTQSARRDVLLDHWALCFTV